MSDTPPNWFAEVAMTFCDVVEEYDGAVVGTCPELVELLQKYNPQLLMCPKTVFEHMTFRLRDYGLKARPYGGTNRIFLVYDGRLSSADARDKCKKRGLSEMVEAVLFTRESAQSRLFSNATEVTLPPSPTPAEPAVLDPFMVPATS